MAETSEHGRLTISRPYRKFIVDEVLPGLDLSADDFFSGLEALLTAFTDRNTALLERRADLQSELDAWHKSNPGPITDTGAYKSFLRDIGYLVADDGDFTISTAGVDPEIATTAGPQLVVPIDNARYALNAANARWGSLYDAYYGTDALGSTPPKGPYSSARGAEVVAGAKAFLDDVAPLEGVSHTQVVRYTIDDNTLIAHSADSKAVLKNPDQFAGYRGTPETPKSVLLVNNGLHIDLILDRAHPVGKDDPAGLADVELESALTAIMDCEDSVATVDNEEKVTAYRNWLGLMKGTLATHFEKGGKTVERRLAPNRDYTGQNGETVIRKGRVVMLVRNVGHLTHHTLVHLDGRPVYEGLLDAMTTSVIALHDRKRPAGQQNAAEHSIYIVKPKMHGPEEVAFACDVFDRVEDTLNLPRNSIKIGIMDEERRTSVNLLACVRAAKDRVFFINTGFLDRTGDEIHTIKQAGPAIPKGDMKSAGWLQSYEDRNVDVGLKAGFRGRAQIGKGMWAMPDLMARLVDEKVGQLEAGASTAWVPSPTAATLHALHYHRVNVQHVQDRLKHRAFTPVDALLDLPVATRETLSKSAIHSDLERNAQSILGYVVRWIDMGVGCSKVPDIDDVGLMEDRATLRISAQHIANWLLHGLIGKDDVEDAFRRMAVVVDAQTAHDPAYEPMAPGCDGLAFKAALTLALEGGRQPSGYTEPLLIEFRTKKLAQ